MTAARSRQDTHQQNRRLDLYTANQTPSGSDPSPPVQTWFRGAHSAPGSSRSPGTDRLPDPAFPAAHPRPRRGWVNDPNGMCRVDGRWHVFFQYNPDSARHDLIRWGHLSSLDLVAWTEEPIALAPSPGGPDSAGCWSGVMAFDDGEPLAVYSGITAHDHSSEVTVVRGSADLREWGPERRVAAPMPADPDVVAVRDPFVFGYEGRRWAIQGAGLADGRAAILLYDAEDLTAWEYLGIWLTTDSPGVPAEARAAVWECPQLAPVGPEGQWVLLVSRWAWSEHTEPASPRLVDTRALFVELSAESAPAAPRTTLSLRVTGSAEVDDGSSFYAPQLLVLPEATVMIGWARETASPEVCDDRGWAGLLTWPRVLSVEDGRLSFRPHTACEGWREGREQRIAAASRAELPDAADVVVDSPEDDQDDVVSLQAEHPDGSRTTVYRGPARRVVLDRSIVEVYRRAGPASTLRFEPVAGQRWSMSAESAALSWWALRPWIPG